MLKQLMLCLSCFNPKTRTDLTRGNRLSNTACLKRVFFRSGESCSEL